MVQELIDITPHRSIMEKIAKTGYNVEDAIAELIDNSIDARKNDLTITIKVSDDKIIISDNGSGMDKQTAANAMRLGFSTKKEKLGEFGLGLKTSALSLGRKFTILTSQGEEDYSITYDLDSWVKDGSWSEHPFTIEKSKLQSSGTSVIIENLSHNLDAEKIENIRKHLSVRFGPFIKNNVKIILNDQECIPTEIKLIDDKKISLAFEISNIKVKGWYGYQLAGHLKNYHGFNTFRRDRLITTFDKIGISPNQKAKQIVGELHIEGVPVTHDKRNWIRESEEFKSVERYMRDLLSDANKNLTKLLTGVPANNGRVEGTVRIINSFYDADIANTTKVQDGDILVTQMTRPNLLLSIRKAGAIVTNLGGATCHAAIVSREFNVPCIVGTDVATKVLKDGQRVVVDATEGVVYDADS